MPPFKPGDRVRVYGGYLKMDGISSHGYADVTVAEVESESSLRVEQEIADGRTRTWFCHPKQCRRLKKKYKGKAREWFIVAEKGTTSFWECHADKSEAERKRGLLFGNNFVSSEIVHVREVIEAPEKGEK